MSVWGATPTCRGFNHYSGFYGASGDYFSHQNGHGYDYHRDFDPDPDARGTYSTTYITTAVANWITAEVNANLQQHVATYAQQASSSPDNLRTFNFVAHQAVHGPLEVPHHYIAGHCADTVPVSHPSRRVYCGMVR